MSRSGDDQKGWGFDRSDAIYLLGTVLAAGGVGWATAPGWGMAVGGGLLIFAYLLQVWNASAAVAPEGGED